MFAVVNDISALKCLESDLRLANRTLNILLGSDHALLHLADEDSFFQEITSLLVTVGGYRLAWIG